ncbi:hypothetical protein H3T61_05575 [Gilliamella sp. B14384H2]|uniref:hypothetical protein n=1 Tax=unclassified Gilliamella TaxID=2685620 RepID=UPI0018DC6889|nr:MULTISPECIES: hypothetical protein [unclassified Gilliamella]MBI0037692.1 hypothetical protein [Gilliamella sp. B14384G10]MBI0039687.1 hypothetical protein [Gilliamella sp. B14384G7]MBI0051527.1 hypothetical protein [Gilliamella sp. B14384G13]MBI0053979.1 hypothetical protein [Gilliamella sp. B14384H2]
MVKIINNKSTLLDATKILVNTAAIIAVIKYDPDLNPSRSDIEAMKAIEDGQKTINSNSRLTVEQKAKITQDFAEKLAEEILLNRTIYHVDENSYINELITNMQHEHISLPNEKSAQLFQRLLAAYHYLVDLKFTEIKIIETYLYAYASDPSFKDNPIIKAWIEKTDQSAQQQFQDMIYVARKFNFIKNYLNQ